MSENNLKNQGSFFHLVARLRLLPNKFLFVRVLHNLFDRSPSGP